MKDTFVDKIIGAAFALVLFAVAAVVSAFAVDVRRVVLS